MGDKTGETKIPVKEKRKLTASDVIVRILLVIAILIILFFVWQRLNPGTDLPDESQMESEDESEKAYNKENNLIRFNGSSQANISKKKPYLQLYNSINNFVDMEFEVTITRTGEKIERSKRIAPGHHANINLYDYFDEAGVYEVTVQTYTYDHETGTQYNGLTQKMTIYVSK